jgi:hypothetical protein
MAVIWIDSGRFGAALDPDAAAYITAVEAADTQALEPAVRAAINDFVVGCKADGIWAAIKASCILAGARTLTGALVPLVGAAPTEFGTPGGWNYDRATGLAGNGTDNYLDSHYVYSLETQNSNHASVGVHSPHTTAGQAGSHFGCGDAVLGETVIGCTRTSANLNNFFNRQMNIQGVLIEGRGQHTGFLGQNRSSSANWRIRSNQTESIINAVSSAPNSRSLFIFANNASSGAAAISNGRYYFYSAGENINLTALDTRLTTLINAFDAAI